MEDLHKPNWCAIDWMSCVEIGFLPHLSYLAINYIDAESRVYLFIKNPLHAAISTATDAILGCNRK